MAYEMLVGLQVLDNDQYQQYRDAMMPILLAHGGGFGYDLQISKVLRSDTNAEINRVFTIYFPDQQKMDAFFANTEYLLIKEKYFNNSVGSTTIMASYEKNT